jgi:hypothetical protein
LPHGLSTAPDCPFRGFVRATSVAAMATSARHHDRAAHVRRLVERAMTMAVEEYDDDAAVRRLDWLARDDHAALDQACDVCLSYIDVDLAIRGRAIGLLTRVRYGDVPS